MRCLLMSAYETKRCFVAATCACRASLRRSDSRTSCRQHSLSLSKHSMRGGKLELRGWCQQARRARPQQTGRVD